MKPNPFRCSDGFCGQEDCARCHPEYLDDSKDEDQEFIDKMLDELFGPEEE
jgi:hypothetical protein